MQIIKRSSEGVIMTDYEGQVLRRSATEEVIQAEWLRPDRDLGYTTFVTGDRFIEYFYSDQWFMIVQVEVGQTGVLKGWYCNINRPSEITLETITYDDLYLDVWVDAGGQTLVLDEDEFAAAALDEQTRGAARAGVAEILRWVAHRLGPFAQLAAQVPPSA